MGREMVGQSTGSENAEVVPGGALLPLKRGAAGEPQTPGQGSEVEPTTRGGEAVSAAAGRDVEALALAFDEVETEGIKLLEIGSDDMLKCLQEGGAVIKASEPDEKVVLCTEDKTFAVRVVETSNSVFLVEDGSSECFQPRVTVADDGEAEANTGGTPGPMTQMATVSARACEGDGGSQVARRQGVRVCTIVSENWEIEQIAPDFRKLDELLRGLEEGGAAGGVEEEEGYTTEELLREIQGSESELLEELHARSDAMQVGDRWVHVSEATTSALVDVLVSKVCEGGWAWGDLPLEQVLSAMEAEDFRREATLHAIRTLGSAPLFLGSVTPESAGLIEESKLCVHYARRLLRKQSFGKAAQFLEEWRKVVPVGMEPSVEMLGGLALVDESGGLVVFDDLPRDPAKRFDALFAHQKRWRAKDLKLFAEGMTIPPGKQMDDVLEDYLHSYHPQGDTSNPLMYVQKVI